MIWYMTNLKQNKKMEKTEKHNIKFKLFNLVYTFKFI